MTAPLWHDRCSSEGSKLRRRDRAAASSDCENALNRKFLFALGSGLLILLTMGAFSYRSIVILRASDQRVRHTHEVLGNLQELLSGVKSIESSYRGFVLTGKESYLDTYQLNLLSAEQHEAAIRNLTVDNPRQQEQVPVLENLMAQKIRFGDTVIGLRRAQGLKAAAYAIESGPGKPLMDDLQELVGQMQDEELRLLVLRDADARRRLRQTTSNQIAVIVVLLLLASAACWNARKFGRQRDRALLVIHDSEAKYRGLLEAAPDAMVVVNAVGEIVVLNVQAEKQFGYTRDELVGKKIKKIIPIGFAERLIANDKRSGGDVLTQPMGAGIELIGLRKDGSDFPTEIMLSPLAVADGVLVTLAIRDITERKRAEEMRERLAAIAEYSDDAIISKDVSGMITAWNRGAERIFGYSSTEVLGKPLLILLPPERRNEEADILARIQRGESIEHFETIRVRKDGTHFDASVTISPIRDGGGAIVGASKIARDVTQRKRTEEALRESEERFETMANGIPQLAHMAGADGVFSWYNQRWYKYTGTTPEQMEGWGWQSVIDPAMLPKVMERWQASIATGEPFDMEFPLRGADGTFRTFLNRVMPLKDSEGHVVRWFGTNTDISEHKAAQELLAAQAQELSVSREALEAQTRMFKLVLDSMGEGLIAADPDGHFLIWNDSAKKLMGRDASDLPTERWTPYYEVFLSDGITPCPPDRLPLVRALHGESVQVEMMVQHPGPARGVFLEVSARPLKDNDGNLGGGVAVLRDITERKAAERQIQTLNQSLEGRVIERTAELKVANEELEAFTYSVSHDLRAPIRHISGFAKIVGEKFRSSLPAEAHEHLQLIVQAAQRMGQMVDEMLKLARLGRQALEVETTGLTSLTADVVALLAPEIEGRQVKWKIDDLPFVECDPILMRQVFQNLISNALKYSRPRFPAVIEIGQTEKDGEKVIFVKDNGVGFDMKYSGKLFGVFQRMHLAEEFEGNGIGLATVERIIKKHGGRVWVEAEMDRGATFYFTLGRGERPAPEKVAASAGSSL